MFIFSLFYKMYLTARIVTWHHLCFPTSDSWFDQTFPGMETAECIEAALVPQKLITVKP